MQLLFPSVYETREKIHLLQDAHQTALSLFFSQRAIPRLVTTVSQAPSWTWVTDVKNPKSKFKQKMACQQRRLRFRVSLLCPITFSFTSHYS